MRKYLGIIAGIMIVLVGCNKEVLDVNLTDHDERRIIGEGFFTDSLEKQRFTFSLSNNLGSESITYTDNVSLLVKTPSGHIDYISLGNGVFESEVPFKGEYGESYTIQFSYKGNVHEIKTEMPEQIEINEFSFVYDSISSVFSNYPEIWVNLNSTAPQYLKFSLFKADSSALPGDTVWVETKLPVYRTVYYGAGTEQMLRLPVETFDRFEVMDGDIIKFETYVISKDVGEYLDRLKNYVTSELINSQFYNPPYYYSNEAYGLGYGTIIDSVIYRVE